MFDQEPDGDPRGDCALEISNLEKKLQLEHQIAQMDANLKFDDAVKIARGCSDYGGGYRGTDHYDAYQDGISTVVRVLEAAKEKGLSTSQLRALHCIGRANEQSRTEAVPPLQQKMSTAEYVKMLNEEGVR
jgi:transposase